ncbi:hypothetical protein Tco_1309114, partial [Tanacetum coccineum]
MACSLSHIINEIKVMVQKQIKEDKVRQLAIMNLVVAFENASIAKDKLRKAYNECSGIPQEKRVSIDTYLKQKSDNDYKMHKQVESLDEGPEAKSRKGSRQKPSPSTQ